MAKAKRDIAQHEESLGKQNIVSRSHDSVVTCARPKESHRRGVQKEDLPTSELEPPPAHLEKR